jgi:protein-tyrosine phosphatase
MNNVYWIESEPSPRLAIVARPRPDDWLADDLAALKQGGIDVLVSFLSDEENAELGLGEEHRLAEQAGLEFISYPIPDTQVPSDVAGFRKMVGQLAEPVRGGKRVGAHCRGCIGRSTVLIASLMIALGSDAEDALKKIERARGLAVPDTPEQRQWVLDFRPTP